MDPKDIQNPIAEYEFRRQLRNEQRNQLKLLLFITCKWYGMTVEEVRAKGQIGKVVEVREMYMYLASILFEDTLEKRIGQHVFRDRGCTVNGIKRMKELMEKERSLRNKAALIKRQYELKSKAGYLYNNANKKTK